MSLNNLEIEDAIASAEAVQRMKSARKVREFRAMLYDAMLENLNLKAKADSISGLLLTLTNQISSYLDILALEIEEGK